MSSMSMHAQLNIVSVVVGVDQEYQKKLTLHDHDNQTRTIKYSVPKDNTPHSYSWEHQYEITNKGDGHLVNPKAIIDPLDISFDQNVRVEQSGDFLFYPTSMKKGDNLDPSISKYSVTIPSMNWSFHYQVSISERKVVGTRIATVDGKKVEGSLIQSNLSLVKYVDGEIKKSKSEGILEVYVEGYGPIKISRGNMKVTD